MLVKTIAVAVILTAFTLTETSAWTDYELAALNDHNKDRGQHRSTPPMRLNSVLNQLAQKCANYYANVVKGIDHSCPYKKNAGENLSWSSSSRGPPGKVAAVHTATKSWYDEYKKYNYRANNYKMVKGTGHFTQMIWTESTQLGIGVASNNKSKSTYVVGLYLKPGNMEGEFQKDVEPFKG